MIAANAKVAFNVMTDVCQHVLHHRGMLDEWKTSVTTPIFEEKSDVMWIIHVQEK